MDKCEILAEKSEMDAEYHQKFPGGENITKISFILVGK